MRIPLSEEDKGYWYPFGDAYYFIPLYSAEWWQRAHLRVGTFAEFKEFFPLQVGWNSRHRTNEKRRMYR